MADPYHFRINQAEIRRELYSLMTLLFADEKMAELVNRGKELGVLSDQVVRLLLPLKLLTVAVAVRSALDSIADNEPSQRYSGDVCGLHFGGDKETKLSLRQACDCVIHAKRTLFYPEETPTAGEFRVFNGKITLYGLHRDRKQPEWKAEIDLEEFALAALAALKKNEQW